MQSATRAFRKLGAHITLVAIGLVGLCVGPLSQANAEETNSLADLSLEELTNLKVSSASKKTERLADTATAVFVITQDDIRRSGAASIPQALRLVPGLQVAQIDGNKWAISARGFNSRFSNRLLVMMDGRTIYTLTFGGVFWDAQDTVIEDIERIEVIRGPGAAIWGANAFNGVINIITKSASQTDGAMISFLTGTQQPFNASARIGDAQGNIKWRAFAKGFQQQPNENWQDREGHDFWRQWRIGGRVDWDYDTNNQLQISSEAYKGASGLEVWNYNSLVEATIASEDNYSGAFATIDWQHTTQGGGHVNLRGVLDHTDRDSLIFGERRNTYELELQHELAIVGRHDLLWGAGIRYTEDETEQTTISVNPAHDSLTILNGFVQDEIAAFDDKFHFTVGAKVENSDYIGTQFLPNIRARYQPFAKTTIWSAISRSVRSASRLERNVHVSNLIPLVPSPIPGAAPIALEIWGDDDFDPEKLTAYELGWRQTFGEAVAIDITAYYNDYSSLRGVQLLTPLCSPTQTPVDVDPTCIFFADKVILPFQFTNLTQGNVWGAETTITWDVSRYWRLIGSYAYLHEHQPPNVVDLGGLQVDFADFSTGLDARDQWTVRSNLTIDQHWDWDVFFRHVARLRASEVASYSELNTRIAWRPQVDFELALVGDNLLHKDHVEFVSDFLDLAPVSIKRTVRLQARWSF